MDNSDREVIDDSNTEIKDETSKENSDSTDNEKSQKKFMESFQDKIFSEILETAKNIDMNNDEKQNSTQDENSETTVDLTEFNKIISDFLQDILLTFPELIDNLDHHLKIIYNKDNEDPLILDNAFKNIYLFAQKTYPERFFDILYQNDKIFDDDENNNTYFLPNIQFSQLWKEDISDQTKKTIWKYIQLILFTVVTNVKSDNCFGETAKLFEAIGEDEFKNKIKETMEEMQNVFSNAQSQENNTEGINMDNLPNPNDIHNHINELMDGKLGKLAKEIAEDTANNLDIDPENINNVGDVFQKLFKDPSKLMGIVKNVGSKLDEKMKSGELKESELIQEATEMMGKMQNLPGMDKMSDIFSKLNMPNFAGNGKFNKGAFDSMMQNNLKKAKTKERMKAKLDDNKKNNDQPDDNLSKSELDKVNQNLQEIMKQLNLDNIPDIMEQINSQNSQNSSKSKKKKGKPAKKK